MGFANGTKWNLDLISKEAMKMGLQILSQNYINCQNQLYFMDENGYLYSRNVSNISLGKENRFVHSSNIFSIFNIQSWIVKEKKPFTLLSKNYVNSKKKLKFLCHECKIGFDASWDNIYQGKSCPYCAGKLLSIYNCLALKFPDIALSWDYNLNKYSPYDYTFGSGKKVWWFCDKCQRSHKTAINIKTSLGRGCPYCNKSKGENKIESWLIKNDIYFIREYRFPECKNKRTLPFDFYIPNGNTCIEFQGKQHYKHMFYFGDEESFLELQKRDEIKKRYCKNQGIKFIEIPYTEINNIDNILNLEVKYESFNR